ncbi:hypothetical protein [Aurantiacibacter poecillastricola]|nr:hypothetical protein [Aurantiacibacter sp. 219JJ12-13]MDP5263184.1 hypothetical protein [Aurantiacibacter sp. 219JJ12-13]
MMKSWELVIPGQCSGNGDGFINKAGVTAETKLRNVREVARQR